MIPRARRLAAVVVAALTVAGCVLQEADRRGDVDGGPLRTVGPTTTARFVRAVDGDTIHVELDGERVAVRLIGLDAPELARDGQPAEPLAGAATDALIALLDDAPALVLERDRSDTDRFGRLLRYAWQSVDGQWRLVNAELVRLGLAEARDYQPDTSRQRTLDEAENEARDERRGIWATP